MDNCQDGTRPVNAVMKSTIAYSAGDGQVVYETADLNKAQWLPCS